MLCPSGRVSRLGSTDAGALLEVYPLRLVPAAVRSLRVLGLKSFPSRTHFSERPGRRRRIIDWQRVCSSHRQVLRMLGMSDPPAVQAYPMGTASNALGLRSTIIIGVHGSRQSWRVFTALCWRTIISWRGRLAFYKPTGAPVCKRSCATAES